MLTDRTQRVTLHQSNSQRRQLLIERAVVTVLQAFDSLTQVFECDTHELSLLLHL
jgi:hypothetical protein